MILLLASIPDDSGSSIVWEIGLCDMIQNSGAGKPVEVVRARHVG